jgi:membrane associated rhomboid family serine protease
MIPLHDENPTIRTPIMTWLILGVMFAVWVLVQGGGMNDVQLVRSVCNYGMVPGELTHRAPLGFGIPIGYGMDCVVDNEGVNLWTPLFSMFLHGGWGHILGNAIYFWVFGNNIEDSMGPWRFLAFYLVCGLAAAGAHVMLDPASPIPTVGASGAISGVMGAYLVLYPSVRVHYLILPIFFRTFAIRAWIALAWWFGMQALSAFLTPLNPETSNGVAVWAHIGGFVAGLVLVKVFEDRRLVAARDAIRAERLLLRQTAFSGRVCRPSQASRVCAQISTTSCSNGAGRFVCPRIAAPSFRATAAEGAFSGLMQWMTSVHPSVSNAKSTAARAASTA